VTTAGRTGGLPDVAVVVITHNHEQFIGESIGSVALQRYPGTIHLVVSDDASTDGTAAAIERAVETLPSNVVPHVLLRKENVGGYRNLSETWIRANETGAAHLALLEGDDFWTDPDKLAAQVSHLAAQPAATLSFGLANELIMYDDAPPQTTLLFVPPSYEPTFEQLLGRNFIVTCTAVYRAGVLPRFPDWFAECPFRDWPLHLVHASAGRMHYLDRLVAVHRQHRASKWWTPAKSQSERIEASERVQRLAIEHLGSPDNYRRSHVEAQRHLWWARASRNRWERWLHLGFAAALDPGVIRGRARRPRPVVDDGAPFGYEEGLEEQSAAG
jgi:glycosyltransferase involved in cell wall biosynthesis